MLQSLRLRRCAGVIGVVSCAILAAGAGHADVFAPNAFSSLAVLVPGSGDALTIDTDALTVTGSAGFTGVSATQFHGPSEVAVFAFADIALPAGVTVGSSDGAGGGFGGEGASSPGSVYGGGLYFDGGSGGGAVEHEISANGGGGGGAIRVGAVGTLSVDGSSLADGGNGHSDPVLARERVERPMRPPLRGRDACETVAFR